MPLAVETILKVCVNVFIFVQIIHTHISSSHSGIQKYTATIRLDTSPVAFMKSMRQPVPFCLSLVKPV